MTFERTREGQKNRSLFYDVDFVCYVEGEDGADHGDDIYFWSSIFRSVWPNRSVAFLCRGGKPQLESLARDVIKDNVESVAVAMDADYSRFFAGKIIDDPRVMYTYGYSWENDVYTPEATILAHRALCMRAEIQDQARLCHSQHWERAEGFLRKMLLSDFHAFRGGGSVVDAAKPGKYIGKDANGFPIFRRDLFLSSLAVINSELRPRNLRDCIDIPLDAIRYLKGKVVALISRYLALACAKEISGARPVSEAHYRHICIEELCSDIKVDAPVTDVARHHKTQVERLGAALVFA